MHHTHLHVAPIATGMEGKGEGGGGREGFDPVEMRTWMEKGKVRDIIIILFMPPPTLWPETYIN